MSIDIWKLATTITGFSVAQSIAFSYAAAKADTQSYLEKNLSVQLVAGVMTVVVMVAVLYALGKCRRWMDPGTPAQIEICKHTFRWMRVSVVYFTSLQLLCLFAYRLFH